MAHHARGVSPYDAAMAEPSRPPTVDDFEPFRRELTGYCYRMLGSGADADDAVQDTMLRAWLAADTFEGRSSVRSWLYRIATHVCIDMGRSRQRRARPYELGPSGRPEVEYLGTAGPDGRWITPIADAAVLGATADPAEIAIARESIRLAVISALQRLAPTQRAALILCDVLRWPARDAAGLLDSSVPALKSALHRARITMAASDDTDPVPRGSRTPLDDDLVAAYVDAFERYDMTALAALLHDDVVQSMPPYTLWLQGREHVVQWHLGPGIGCQGSKLLRTAANGTVAFAQYRPDPAGGWTPWALQLLEGRDGRIGALNAFVGSDAIDRFGFPPRLDEPTP